MMRLGVLLLLLVTSVASLIATPRWTFDDPELHRQYIAPRTSLGETEVDWEPILRPLAEELTRDAQTPLDAALLLNRHLWKRIGVIYSTRREKPNQDPLHSIRLGLASCSGLSILLVDACRSIGIPARVVGCQWRFKPGNHTWVEVYSGGEWFPLGAFEDCPPDKLWFLDDAANALADDPRYAIYAARATPSPEGTLFYGWGVPADNVTARYLRASATAPTLARIHISAERTGQRVAVPFTVNGKTYTTPGPLRDLNDTTTLELPRGGSFILEIEGQRIPFHAEPNLRLIISLSE